MERVKQTKYDMFENWLDEKEDDYSVDETIDDEKKYCYFSMYESGDYTRLHNDITLQEVEVIE